MTPLLFLCFFLSGAAALIYEVVWMRMLTQIFGSSAYAVATVLAAFMAGLALGSYLFGRIAGSRRNLLRLYGILEFGIGLYGLAAPHLFTFARGLYPPLFWLYDFSPLIFNLLLFLLAFVLLLPPTFLMGATLPIVSQFFVRSFSHLGRRVGDLYGTNTLGAVIGCSVAGYFIIPEYGMSRTVYAAAAANLFIAVLILLLARIFDDKRARGFEEARPAEESGKQSRSRMEWLLLASIALSGAAAMIYENAWTHALALVIGGSVYSFTTMLLTFLIGLAAGGYLYARLFGGREVRATVFGLIELGVGLTALATIPLFEKLPLIFIRLHQGFGDAFSLLLSTQVFLAFLVMFLPTLLLGMTFPLVVCLFTQSLYRVGSGVGTTYASNTLGAILGAFIGGFILLPLIGIQKSILVGALLNLSVGWLLLVADPRPGRVFRLVLGGAAAGGLVLLAARFPYWDRAILTSGVTVYAHRYEQIPTDSLRLEEMRRDEIIFYREGLTATISVHQSGKDYRYFKTNGKVDGSYGDALTMYMTGYLPMLLKPQVERAAVIGLGTGMTVRAIGAFPVKKIEVLEIEPEMARAAALFGEKNGKILEDPRVRVIPTDGRNYIMATPHLYDLIISEPSNPWIAGIAGLFTREFYAVAKGKLTPDGIFAQWIHNYSMSPDDFRMVMRTFGDAFPYLSVWNLQESDFLLVGSLKEQGFDHRRLQKIFSENKILREDFQSLGLSHIHSVLGFYRMGKKELSAFAEGAEYNTDDNARLEFSAPRSLGKATSDLNRKYMESFLAPAPWTSDPTLSGPAEHHYHLAESYHASSRDERAIEEIDRAIRLEPLNPDYHLLRAQILVAQENSAAAAKAAGAALELKTDKLKQVLALAEELYTRQAKPIYARALSLDGNELIPYLGLANIALHEKKTAEAEKWLSRAAEMQPEHPAVLFALGKLESSKGNFEKAAARLEQSERKGEESAGLYAEMGQAYSELKQWRKAARAFDQALKRRRRNIEWRLALARALRELGRNEEAALKYREVLALQTNSAEAWKGLRELGKSY